jgi:hypothetical protein
LRYLGADAPKVEARLDDLRNMFTSVPGSNTTIVPGQGYKNLLSDVTRSYGSAEGDVRFELGKLRDMLRQQMEASMPPADQARWRQLNRYYANGKVIQDAMGAAGAGTAEGDISLLQLRGAINRSMGTDAYSRGFGDLNDMARAGQSVLRQPPDSGSPQGIAINALLKGVPLAAGGAGGYYGGMEGFAAGLATPWAIGTAMRGRIPGTNFSPGQSYLANQLTRNVDPRVMAGIIQAADAETQRNQMMPRP